MATDLTKLKVSLTKHGAHKIAYLVAEFDKDDVLNHLDGDFRDINIDFAQTRKILSIDDDGVAPNFWNEIKQFGEEDVFDLVFLSIVLSHHDLMDCMIQGFEDGAVIIRGKIIDGKAYTNFARIIEDLGFAIEHTADYVSFDISRIFYKFYLSSFIFQLIELKLIDAGWEKENSLIDESIKQNIHLVFNLSPNEFTAWLEANQDIETFARKITKPKRKFKNGIDFKSGHNAKFDGELEYEVTSKRKKQLKHNQIQNELFKILTEQYPEDKIGTEIKTNVGSVDLVRVSSKEYIFYEIKTADTVKTSIRQALSQLLEYAYWNKIENVSMLIIVAPNRATNSAVRYLRVLRERFNIPIYYQQFNIEDNSLGEIK